MRFSSLALFSLAGAAAFVASADPNTNHAQSVSCPDPTLRFEGQQFHSDTVCNRHAFNAYKASLQRHLTYEQLKNTGSVESVPNQKTVHCPLEPQQFRPKSQTKTVSSSSSSAATIGMDTVWIVRNTATTPVVVAFVTETSQYGGHPVEVEVSARHGKISPPEADPEAILQPGQWMAVHTFEGHVFHVKELLPDGTAGRILVQHQTGLVPVGSASMDECPDGDVEPVTEENVVVPEFQRTEPAIHRPCHTMDVGFRNAGPCPLHAYYVHPSSSSSEEPCQEQFQFHLGVEGTGVKDFMWDWTSKVRALGCFLYRYI
jgi:hypothetical protein